MLTLVVLISPSNFESKFKTLCSEILACKRCETESFPFPGLYDFVDDDIILVVTMQPAAPPSQEEAKSNNKTKHRDLELWFGRDGAPLSPDEFQEKLQKCLKAPEDQLGNFIFGILNEKLSEKILGSIVFTDAVKCYNSEITPEMEKNCLDFLKKEINLLNPKAIITLGGLSRDMVDMCPKAEKKHKVHFHHPSFWKYNKLVSKAAAEYITNRIKPAPG